MDEAGELSNCFMGIQEKEKDVEEEIQLIDIDRKLKELWDEEQGKNLIRACLFNFVIYTKKEDKNTFYQKLIQSVIAKFPCRVIWITEEKNSEKRYLKTHVRTQALSEAIFCEIIEIEVTGQYLERVPSLVLPRILPDLPVYLLWGEVPTKENLLFPFLLPLSTKIIFDAAYVENVQDFFKTTYQLAKQYPRKVSELVWGSLKGIRHLFNTILDTKETFDLLLNVKTIQINYNCAIDKRIKHSEIKSAYLQGWFASTLQWKFQNIESTEKITRITYRSQNRDVVVQLVPIENPDCSLPPGAILSCDIESVKNNAHFILKRYNDMRKVFLQYTDDVRCDLPICYYLSGIVEGQEIINEIFYGTEEKHYHNTLELISQIPWRSK